MNNPRPFMFTSRAVLHPVRNLNVAENAFLTLALAEITRTAQHLKSGRKIILYQPEPELPAAAVPLVAEQFFAVLRAVTVHVINAEVLSTPAARARRTVVREHPTAQLLVPLLVTVGSRCRLVFHAGLSYRLAEAGAVRAGPASPFSAGGRIWLSPLRLAFPFRRPLCYKSTRSLE
jgi:hypothetical protein